MRSTNEQIDQTAQPQCKLFWRRSIVSSLYPTEKFQWR